MSWKKSKQVRIYVDSEKKENRTPYVVGPDAELILNANGVRGLLNMGISSEAYKFILANINTKKPDLEWQQFRVNAQKKVETAEAIRHGLILNATPYEIKMKMILKELNVHYEFQKIYYVGFSFYVVDFYLPEYNMVLELDGSQHYGFKDSQYDRLRTENLIYLHKISKVLRFDNRNLDVDTDVKKRLTSELNL